MGRDRAFLHGRFCFVGSFVCWRTGHSAYDGGLGNSLRTSAAQEQLFEDVGSWKPRLIVACLPDWTPEVSEATRGRTGCSPEVSDQYDSAVAFESRRSEAPSGLPNSGWSGC